MDDFPNIVYAIIESPNILKKLQSIPKPNLDNTNISSLHVEYRIIKLLQNLHKIPRKLTIYLYRVVQENNPSKCFQLETGEWIAPAFCCRNCVLGFERKHPWVFNIKWLTPTQSGWVNAIKQDPLPSSGQRIKWFKNGIPLTSAKWLIDRGIECPYTIR